MDRQHARCLRAKSGVTMNKPRNQRSATGRVHYVYARRARTLRRRGEDIRGFGINSNGRQIYVWFPKR